MLGIHDYWLFVATGVLLNLTPGQDTLYILGRSIAQGRQIGVASALGISAGAVVHTVAAALGLSAVLATSASAFVALKVVGAVYLVYLGVRMLMTRTAALGSTGTEDLVDRWTAFRQGMLTNILNPKVALFFLALMPQFIEPESPTKVGAFLRLGCGGAPVPGAVVPRARPRARKYRLGGRAGPHRVHARHGDRRPARRALGAAYPQSGARVRAGRDHGGGHGEPAGLEPPGPGTGSRALALAARRSLHGDRRRSPRARPRRHARADDRDGHDARVRRACRCAQGNHARARHAVRREHLRRRPRAAPRRVLPDRRARAAQHGAGRCKSQPPGGSPRSDATAKCRGCGGTGAQHPRLPKAPAVRRCRRRRPRTRARSDLVPPADPLCAGQRYDLRAYADRGPLRDCHRRRPPPAAFPATPHLGHPRQQPRRRGRLPARPLDLPPAHDRSDPLLRL